MPGNEISLEIEEKIWRKGYSNVAGIDEAGRGPLAGPVVAAAVIFEKGSFIKGVNDSKLLSPSKREKLFEEITQKAMAYGIGLVDNREIDRTNIVSATHKAMRKALGQIRERIDYILVDGNRFPDRIYPQTNIVGGDRKSFTIAAASILAKVYRDRLMKKYDKLFPEYGFGKHMGYGTKEHREAIKKHNPCPIHRRSFSGVKEYVEGIFKNNKSVGKYGEQIAVKYLFDKDFEIVETNYRKGSFGEIDIIAKKDEALYFVEVKTQTGNYFPPELKVDDYKMKQIARIAEEYIFEKEIEGVDVKFSVISVLLKEKSEKIKFYEEAFTL